MEINLDMTWSDGHSHDYWMHMWLLNNYSRRTDDYARADLVFVPAYPNFCLFQRPTCHNHTNHCDSQWWYGLNEQVAKAHQSNIPSNRLFGACTYPGMSPRFSACKDNHERPGLFHRMTQLLHMQWLRVTKDVPFASREVVVPYVVNASLVPFSLEPRMHLLFVPSRNSPGRAGTSFMRWFSHQLLEYPNVVGGDNLTSSAFDTFAATSEFCLVVPGDTTSTSRLSKFIFAGCVPVVVTPSPTLLPFSNILNWSSFCVLADTSELVTNQSRAALYQRILEVRDQERLRMRGVLRDVRRLLDWSIGAFPSVFHLTLLELKRNTVLDRTILDGSGDRVIKKTRRPPNPLRLWRT